MPVDPKLLIKAGVYFWPPNALDPMVDPDMKTVRDWCNRVVGWSRRMAWAFYGMAIMWLIAFAWILGWLPMWIPQPAYAVDLTPLRIENAQLQSRLTELQTQISENDIGLRLGQLEPVLDDALRNFCQATRAVRAGQAPQAMVDLYLEKLRGLENQYRLLKRGEPYMREPCDSIVIPVPMP